MSQKWTFPRMRRIAHPRPTLPGTPACQGAPWAPLTAPTFGEGSSHSSIFKFTGLCSFANDSHDSYHFLPSQYPHRKKGGEGAGRRGPNPKGSGQKSRLCDRPTWNSHSSFLTVTVEDSHRPPIPAPLTQPSLHQLSRNLGRPSFIRNDCCSFLMARMATSTELGVADDSFVAAGTLRI
jgi:hypothetical protein